MSTLLLLRHGQAAFGEDNYDQLSGLGQTQARAAGEFFRERQWHFDRVLCGPRHRHRDTAILALGPESPLETVDLLDEFAEGHRILQTAETLFDAPVFTSSEMSRRQRLEYYLATIERWAAGDTDIEGTPPAENFLANIDRWLTSLATESPSSSHVLAVTSAGVIAALMCRVLNLPAREIANLMRVSDNGSLTTILFSGQRLSLQGFNASGHLARDSLSAI